MSSESPTQKVKSCNSCRRSLPLYYFGLRKFSADGYNPCCKECRNFRRRKAYQNPPDQTDSILPLTEHNRHFLWRLPESIRHEFFVGLDLKILKTIAVTYIKKSQNDFSLTVQMPDGTRHTQFHVGEKSSFIDFTLPLLNRLQIRLFHPGDAIALTNWGLSTR